MKRALAVLVVAGLVWTGMADTARAAAEAHRKEMHHQAGDARRESAKAAGKREAERKAAEARKLFGTRTEIATKPETDKKP